MHKCHQLYAIVGTKRPLMMYSRVTDDDWKIYLVKRVIIHVGLVTHDMPLHIYDLDLVFVAT